MTEDDFRRLALALPATEERSHMDHPDFRVGGKIFATLYRGGGMVKLTPDQQRAWVASAPEVFSAVPGGWGRAGATRVELGAAKEEQLRPALAAAWRRTAPKRIAAAHPKLPGE